MAFNPYAKQAIFQEPKRPQAPNIRDLTNQELKNLQSLIKLVQQHHKTPARLPKSIRAYQRQYHVSWDTARSDYIYEWSRYLTNYANRVQKNLVNYLESNKLAYSYKFHEIGIYETTDWVTGAKRRTTPNQLYGRIKSRLAEAYKVRNPQSSWLPDTSSQLYKDIRSGSNPASISGQWNLQSVGGSYNALALANLWRALTEHGMTDAIHVLGAMDPADLLEAWRQINKKGLSLFDYIYEDEFQYQAFVPGEFAVLNAFYQYIPDSQKGYLFFKYGYPESVGVRDILPDSFYELEHLVQQTGVSVDGRRRTAKWKESAIRQLSDYYKRNPGAYEE